MINENNKYSIHWGRFETEWVSFCEENYLDRDDEKLREIWENAYFQGAIGVLDNHIESDDEKLREIWERAYFEGFMSVMQRLEVIKKREQE